MAVPLELHRSRRATPKKCQWGRRGRNINNLPNTYDDICVDSKKSWKHKRLKQYHVGEHVVRNIRSTFQRVGVAIGYI